MARRYPIAVDDAIRAMLEQGDRPSEIHRKLADNECGLGEPFQIPERTFFGKLARAKADLDEEAEPPTAEELATIQRRFLARIAHDLRTKQRKGEPFTAEDERKARVLREGLKAPAKQGTMRGNGKGEAAPESPTLGRIGKALNQDEQDADERSEAKATNGSTAVDGAQI